MPQTQGTSCKETSQSEVSDSLGKSMVLIDEIHT